MEKSESYLVENDSLNMKGKQFAPLKTEEVKLVLRPEAKGQYAIKPKILSLDGGGTYKIYELEPVEITVRELGLSGWVKAR